MVVFRANNTTEFEDEEWFYRPRPQVNSITKNKGKRRTFTFFFQRSKSYYLTVCRNQRLQSPSYILRSNYILKKINKKYCYSLSDNSMIKLETTISTFKRHSSCCKAPASRPVVYANDVRFYMSSYSKRLLSFIPR